MVVSVGINNKCAYIREGLQELREEGIGYLWMMDERSVVTATCLFGEDN